MTGLPAPVLPRIGKLIRLLGSPQDHQVLGAARGLVRTLHGAGSDLHDLAQALERPLPRKADQPEAEPRPSSTAWRPYCPPKPERWAWLEPNERVMALGRISILNLSAWERDFCRTIDAQLRQTEHIRLSDKQQAVFDRLLARGGLGGAASASFGRPRQGA